MSLTANTRRWTRHLADLPVRIVPDSETPVTVFQGFGTEISQGGMAVYVGANLNTADRVEVEFETLFGARVTALIRSRMGYCFGLEFLSPLDEDFARAPGHRANNHRPGETLFWADVPFEKGLSLGPNVCGLEEGEVSERLRIVLEEVAACLLPANEATGAAICTLVQDHMICRAAAGLPFFKVGDRISTRTGLAAACIQKQLSQWCNDTEDDPRVDLEICRQFQLRSLVVVPVFSGETVAGLIGMFSPRPHAFTLYQLKMLRSHSLTVAQAIESWREK